MGLDKWQAIGIVAGSITAVLVLLALVVRAVRRMFTSVRNTVRKLNKMADDLVGDRRQGVPSITDRVLQLDRKLDEHLAWHQPTSNGLHTSPPKGR